MDEGLTLNFPVVGSMSRSACIRRSLVFSPSLAKSTLAASAEPMRILFFAALVMLWACFADGCPAQVTCRVHWECPAGSTGIAGCEGLMHGMSGDGTAVQYASSSQCQSAIANLQDGLRRTCNCGPDTSSDVTASNGFELKSTGSATGDLVNDAAQLWILQNIKNPYTMTFAQNFTQSFLTSYIQGQKQREQIEANIRRQQEIQAEQAREAEQRRIDAIFARLNSELKLSGIDSRLWLKTGGDPTQLAMKLNNSGSDGLAFKLGGTPSAPAAAPQPDPANETGGLKLKLGDESAAGSPAPSGASSTANTNPAPAMGIPGLPGIYLNDIPPAKSPEVAAAALSMDGQERDIAEDAALQAAQKNPALTTPSDDPFVQDYQQHAQEYADAEKAQQAALDKAAEAQGHVQADQTALDYANGVAHAPGAGEQQLQALAQLQVAASSDEDLAIAARTGFDTAGTEASLKREEAAISLASLAPPTIPAQSGQLSPPPTVSDVPLRDEIAASQVKQPSGSTPVFGSPAAEPVAHAPSPQPVTPQPVGSGLPILSPAAKPQIFPPVESNGKPAFAWESVQQCLAQTTSPSQPNPSLDQLKQQLEATNRAYDQLLKSMEEQSEEWKEWKKKWQQAGRDSVFHLYDNIVDRQVEGAVETAKEPIDEEAEVVKKKLDEVVEQYRDYHYAMSGTQEMSGVTRTGVVIFTPNDVVQHQMLSMADFRAKLIPLNSERMALVSRLAELEQEKKRADLLLSAIKMGRDKAFKKLDKSSEKPRPGDANSENVESPFSSMDGLLNWLQKDETGEHLHEFLDLSFAGAKYTGVGVPVAEGGEFALEMIDLSYDVGVEIVAFNTMRQTDQNNAKFKQAQLSLQKRITRLTAEMSCYYHSGAGAGAEAAQ